MKDSYLVYGNSFYRLKHDIDFFTQSMVRTTLITFCFMNRFDRNYVRYSKSKVTLRAENEIIMFTKKYVMMRPTLH